MPASFVALRHEATHVALPNLKKLDRAAREALDWLWHFYWAKHGDLNAESTAPSNLDEIRASIKIELKSYSKQRRNEIKDFGTGDGVTSIHTEYIYKAILSVHPTEKWCADALIWNLVGEKMMFPSRAKSDIPISMAGAFALWDPLLQRLLSHLGWKFLEGLVTRLLNILTETPQSLVSQKVPQNLPKAWLLHILASTEWADSPLLNYYRHEILSLVMATCFSSPGKWTNELAQDLIEAYNEGFREEWDPILDASRSGKEFGDGSGVVDVTDGGKVWTIADKEFEEAEGHDSWVPTSILCMQRRKPVGSIA
ncbi:MAG: rRNA-processing protein las1 [Bogoriella megaspora]|nr:MAG: rRNA-processing protein las1 [Bogoriella megaspora]